MGRAGERLAFGAVGNASRFTLSLHRRPGYDRRNERMNGER
jgi:hypothetical protein